jgi:virulence-associated protein VagC
MEILSDEMMEVANSATAENVQAVRLQIDTMKWLMSKLLPKKYGDLPATQVNIGTSGQTLVITPELAARIQEQRKQALARIEAPEQQAAERN